MTSKPPSYRHVQEEISDLRRISAAMLRRNGRPGTYCAEAVTDTWLFIRHPNLCCPRHQGVYRDQELVLPILDRTFDHGGQAGHVRDRGSAGHCLGGERTTISL